MRFLTIVVLGLSMSPMAGAWEYKPKSQIRADKARALAKKLKAPKKAKVAQSKKFRGLRKQGPIVLKGVIVGERKGNIIFRSGFGEYHINKDAVALRNKKTVARLGLRQHRTYSLNVEPQDIRIKTMKSDWVGGVTR